MNHLFDLLARHNPRRALGLTLTVTFAALVIATSALGSQIIEPVFDRDDSGPDHATLSFMVAHRADWLTAAARVVTLLGSALILVPLSIAVSTVWRWRRGDWVAAWLLAVAMGGASLSFSLVKRLTHRARPPARLSLVEVGGLAFPSGHAVQAAAVGGALAFLATLVVGTRARKVTAWTAAVLISGLIGLTRLYLGVHWLSDVAAGWALGGLWLLAILGARRSSSRWRSCA